MTSLELSDDEKRQVARKHLWELSIKSIAKSIELEELTEEQKQWIKKHGF